MMRVRSRHGFWTTLKKAPSLLWFAVTHQKEKVVGQFDSSLKKPLSGALLQK
jgi:hypothetical protein